MPKIIFNKEKSAWKELPPEVLRPMPGLTRKHNIGMHAEELAHHENSGTKAHILWSGRPGENMTPVRLGLNFTDRFGQKIEINWESSSKEFEKSPFTKLIGGKEVEMSPRDAAMFKNAFKSALEGYPKKKMIEKFYSEMLGN